MDRERIFDVSEHGADRTGRQHATTAFQTALDACGAAGGGMVYVPPGEYRLGRVFLRSRTEFHLAAGAVIRPMPGRELFPPVDGHPDSTLQRGTRELATRSRYSLIHGLGLEDVTLSGAGAIVGDGQAYWSVKHTGDFPAWRSCPPHHFFTAQPFRPILLLLERCRNVTLAGWNFVDAPCYAAWFVSCEAMRLTGCRVANNLAGPNTDGFHFTSSRDVRISDCSFTCGDDCIAIDGNDGLPARDYTISNCTFRTTVNALRLFTGLEPDLDDRPADGAISSVTNVVATGCAVSDASGVFNLVADRGELGHIVASDWVINMDQRGTPFFLLTRNGGRIHEVSLSHLTIRSDGLGTISGEDGGAIHDIDLSDLRYLASPRTKLYGNGLPDPLPSYGLAHYAPYNLYLRHARDLRLRNLTVRWGEADLTDLDQVPNGRASWSGIEATDVHGLWLDRVECPAYGSGHPPITLTECSQIHNMA